MRRPLRNALVLSLTAVLAILPGCTPGASGPPGRGDVLTAPVDPSFLHGSDGRPLDQLAAATVVDVQDYWRQTFPATFDRQWTELNAGYYSVDTMAQGEPAPPCAASVQEMSGNAYYCPSMDALAWDRAALLPVLRDHYGQASVVLALAHEMGHAVQQRTGVDEATERAHPRRYPSELVEGMADCYAGSTLRWIVDGHAPHLHITPDQLDASLQALTVLRDPVGTSSGDTAAHGSTFDRVSALVDGYTQGPRQCSGMTAKNRRFVQREFRDGQDQSGGSLPLGTLVDVAGRDMNARFGRWVARRGGRWSPVALRRGPAASGCAPSAQGPVSLCPGPAIGVDTAGALPRLHHDIGAFADVTVLASRYALGARAAVGEPTRGPAAQRGTLCLTGAYSADIARQRTGFGLSPGDLDEAVQLLLSRDTPSRDAAGHGLPRAFDRFEAFRRGFLRGFDHCE